MRVLVACEYSGRVRDAFLARGHDAWSCDVLPTEAPGPHFQCDVRDVLGDGWDLMVAHPPCTHLATSGARHFHRKQREQEVALDFVRLLATAPIARICIENPVSIISSRLGPPTQIVQPYQFGHEAQKTTCLWLHWLPPLKPTNVVGKGEFITFASGRRMAKWYSKKDWKLRSTTFQGIADAMADQWGSLPSMRSAA